MANINVTEHTPEILVQKLDEIDGLLRSSKDDTQRRFAEFKASSADKKAVDDLADSVARRFADAVQRTQDLSLALNDVKRQLDSPLYGTDAQVSDAERKAAVDHERTLFTARNEDPGAIFDEKRVDLARYRHLKSATRKLIVAANELDFQHRNSMLSQEEKKALAMAMIDGSYFLPEVQQIIRDCFLEPAGLFDLYDSFAVSKMSFMYPFIRDHAMLGGYVCSDDCGTVQAANVNLQFRQEQVYDWRGTFCVTTRVLSDSAIDILALMAREMALAKRMTSNQAWINGDGVKQPKGWLAANLFPVVKTATDGAFTAADLRSFLYRVPPEYGNIQVVMHPNTLAAVMSMTSSLGEFMFGEGELFPDLNTLSNRIRLSRYMPEVDWTVTQGGSSTTAQISAPAGSLVAAAANWKRAYMVPTLLPMMMRQGYQVLGPWCAQYHFWSQDGGAPVCSEAGAVLQVA